MKKFAKFVALALAAAMMMIMTACSADDVASATAQVGKADILKQINAYRTEIGLEELTEVKELSEVEQAYLDIFGKASKTTLNINEADTAKFDELYAAVKENWRVVWANGAHEAPDGTVELLMPATSLATVQSQIKVCAMFDDEWVDSIGIATTTINGQIYWSFTSYYAK